MLHLRTEKWWCPLLLRWMHHGADSYVEGSERGLERVAEVVDGRQAAFGFQAREVAQRLVFLAADGAAVEVLPQAGHRRIGVLAGDFEVDVLRDEVEAVGARDLHVRRLADMAQQAVEVWPGHGSLRLLCCTALENLSSRHALSLRRPSCSSLENRLRFHPHRAANPASGTPAETTALRAPRG